MVADSCVDLARSYVGIAVKAGAAHPDIATEAALRAALLGGRSVAYSRIGASGILFAQLIERLGIASEINARARSFRQGFTAERLVTGEADLAVQQISELKQVAGIEVVGPIPRELQTPAVFSAGRMAASNKAAPAERLLRFLASPEVAPVLREVRAGALNLPAPSTQPAAHEEAILPARVVIALRRGGAVAWRMRNRPISCCATALPPIRPIRTSRPM